MSTSAFAELALSPDAVEIRNVSEPATVLVTYQGNPVSANEITGIIAGVYKTGDAAPETAKDGKHFSNYSYMFGFKVNDDGSVTIKADENSLQAGTYHLYVHTRHGKVSGLIRATLTESFSTQQRPQARVSKFSYGIVLPDYKYGQQTVINLNPDEVNTYSWYINGELHSSGLGETSFSARLEVGTHEVSFVAKSPDGQVVSEWSDTTEVTR